MNNSTKNTREVENFNAMAGEWWDENGPMKPLHRLNPVRIHYLRDRICAQFGRDPLASLPLKGLKILDLGCGGGIVCEPLARLGATVTGLDAAEKNIEIAQAHAETHNLSIVYKTGLAEDMAGAKTRYDVVLALEIVEHVDNLSLFLKSCAALLKKDGLLVLSTLNRNPKSFLLGIVAAEYLLRWVPKGTHDWKKFLKPSELAAELSAHGLKPQDLTGLVYDPLRREFKLSRDDFDVNYFMSFSR